MIYDLLAIFIVYRKNILHPPHKRCHTFLFSLSHKRCHISTFRKSYLSREYKNYIFSQRLTHKIKPHKILCRPTSVTSLYIVLPYRIMLRCQSSLKWQRTTIPVLPRGTLSSNIRSISNNIHLVCVYKLHDNNRWIAV